MSIAPHLDAVFIHVTKLRASIEWYRSLLGIPAGISSHEEMIHEIPVEGATRVLLDAHPGKASSAGTGPRIMFSTEDLAAARVLAASLSPSVSEPEDIGSAMVFYVEDPDHNLICIIQHKLDQT